MEERPKMSLIGQDGNIFAILGRARRLLVENNQREEAAEMFQRVTNSEDYHQALRIISEYVETELSEFELQQEQIKPSVRVTQNKCR